MTKLCIEIDITDVIDGVSTDRRLSFSGRAAWALLALIEAGDAGCTPIDTPGPRWSHYVFLLRRAGIDVETITENHGGPFAGHHAHYILRSGVRVVAIEGERMVAA